MQCAMKVLRMAMNFMSVPPPPPPTRKVTHVHEFHVSNTPPPSPIARKVLRMSMNFMSVTPPHTHTPLHPCHENVMHVHQLHVSNTPPPSPSYSVGGKHLACTPRPCEFSFQETNKNLKIVSNDQNTERVQIKQKYRTTQIIMHIVGMVVNDKNTGQHRSLCTLWAW